MTGSFMLNHTVEGVPLNMSAFLNQNQAVVDAGQVTAIETALKAVESTIYERPFAPLRSAELIARKFDAGAWARSTSYVSMEGEAEMKPIGGLAGDLKEASTGIDETITPVREFGVAYGYGRKELIYAAKMGLALDDTKARLCMRAYEVLVDKLAAHGDKQLKLPGLLTAGLDRTKSDVGLDAGFDNQAIMALLVEIASRVPDATDEAYSANTMAMPVALRDYIANTPYNNNDSRSIMEVFLQNNEYVDRITAWNQLKHAGARKTGKKNNHVIACLPRLDDTVIRQQIPEAFNSLDPQQQGMRTVVNCVASIGGVEIIHKAGMVLYEVPSKD